jgi:hypothetical protein
MPSEACSRSRVERVTIRGAALAALLGLVVSCTTPPSALPSPTGTVALATSTPTPTPTATASPSPSPTRPGIGVTAVGQIPADQAYLLSNERVLLFDLTAKRTREVVRFDRPQVTTRSVVISASADGQTLAILERIDALLLLHIVRPATGELKTIVEPDGVDSLNLSPDGKRVAVSRASTDPTINGLWLLPIDGSPGTRLIAEDPGFAGSPPKPRAWSIDSRWLAAYGAVGAGGNQILVVDTLGASTTYVPSSGLSGGDGRVLTGIDAVWRGSEVLVWNTRAAFGGVPVVASYDIGTRATTTVFTAAADQTILDVVARPLSRQAAVQVMPQTTVTPSTPRTILLVEPGVAPRALRESPFLSRMWWSADGARLYARLGGDDSTGTIADVFGTWGSMLFCSRGGDAPACT